MKNNNSHKLNSSFQPSYLVNQMPSIKILKLLMILSIKWNFSLHFLIIFNNFKNYKKLKHKISLILFKQSSKMVLHFPNKPKNNTRNSSVDVSSLRSVNLLISNFLVPINKKFMNNMCQDIKKCSKTTKNIDTYEIDLSFTDLL